MSPNTGLTRSYKRQLEEEIKEKGEVITSSPALSPSDLTARWSPAVPDETAHEYLTPAYSAIFLSNSLYLGPSERWPDFKTSVTAAISLLSIYGLATLYFFIASFVF